MRRLIILIAALALVAALPAVAPAKSDLGVMKTGRCSSGASWKLKAKHDDGLIEVEFEVDQNISGRRWNIVLKRDGAVVFRVARITRPPSGSFEVNQRIRNPAGSDRIVGSARSARGGQLCRGVVSI
jgi:hypothetical protein